MKIPLALALGLALAPLASPRARASFSCHAAPRSDRTQQVSGVLNAPVDAVWTAITTPEGIVRCWGVAHAEVDFRLGGTIRTHYDEKARIGDPGTIVHTILAYEPGRMLAIKAQAPEGAPEFLTKFCEAGWHVVRIEPLGPDRTRYTETGVGYSDDENGRKAYEFFERGNAWTLEHMKKSFGSDDAPAKVDTAFTRLRALAGHDFVVETKTPGGVFRAHTRWSRLLGDGFLLAEGWLGDADGMWSHGHAVYGVDPQTGALAFWTFGEKSTLARGSVIDDGGALLHDWTLEGPGAAPQHLAVELTPSAEVGSSRVDLQACKLEYSIVSPK